MKKFLVVLMIAALLASGMIVSAGPPAKGERGRKGQAGKSNVAFIELWEKDDNWDIVSDGAWGKMKYNLSGAEFDFVFNGHDLVEGEDYSLIYYPDPWPGEGLICLGSGTVNDEGDVHIQNSVETGDLPAEGDENEGAKIWLVPSDYVQCEDGSKVTGWPADPSEPPEGWLFETELITFDDTDAE